MKTHRFAPASLVFGLLFAGIGLTFLQGDDIVWRVDWSWIWPALLVAGGVLVVMTARPRPQADTPEQVEDWSDTDAL